MVEMEEQSDFWKLLFSEAVRDILNPQAHFQEDLVWKSTEARAWEGC